VSGVLDAAELGPLPVVAPVVTVWVRVVQLLDGRRHREPVRAELAGRLAAGTPEQRHRLAIALRQPGARHMVTLWAGGRPSRELTGAHEFEATDPATTPGGVWGRFAVELAGQEAALALVRRVARPADALAELAERPARKQKSPEHTMSGTLALT
jgi:hypothetical protein